MQHHLEVMGEKVRETFAFMDFESLEGAFLLEREPGWQRSEPLAGPGEIFAPAVIAGWR